MLEVVEVLDILFSNLLTFISAFAKKFVTRPASLVFHRIGSGILNVLQFFSVLHCKRVFFKGFALLKSQYGPVIMDWKKISALLL